MKEYQQIKQQLEGMRHELLGRVEAIAKDFAHGDRPLDPDFEEQAIERENEEVLDALDASARQELFQIERALQRIEGGNYGRCRSCDEEIPLARLQAVPYTEYCIDCAADVR